MQQNCMDEKHDIAKRLEHLNKWRDEQKRLLQENQNVQRQMLSLKQKKTSDLIDIAPIYPESDQGAVDNDRKKESEGSNNEKYDDMLESPRGGGLQNTNIPAGASKPYLRRGEGIKQRFKVDPDSFRLNNLPPYKYRSSNNSSRSNICLSASNRRSRQSSKESIKKQEINTATAMDVQEQNFQKVLRSTDNICNSTPDNKLSTCTKYNDASSYKEQCNENSSEFNSDKPIMHSPRFTEIKEGCGISWAQVLNTQHIKPVSVKQLRPSDNTREFFEEADNICDLSVFELLEQKANEGALDLNSTSFKHFLQKRARNNKQEQDDDIEIPVESHLQAAGLHPRVVDTSTSVWETEEEEELSSYDNQDNEEITQQNGDTVNNPIAPMILSKEENGAPREAWIDQGSSTDLYQKFHRELFETIASKDDTDCNDTLLMIDHDNKLPSEIPQKTVESQAAVNLQERTSEIKSRLAELEEQIKTFKAKNMDLTNAKREIEMEKVIFANQKVELKKSLSEERMEMELYLHEERMKIEDEKRKFERQVQIQKASSNSKDRKEISRLKQELEDANIQLRQKEQAHVAAQGRLRVQIRSMERERKSLSADIERLSQENKQLQRDLLAINRDNSKKMLQEINRNIAKLAPKLPDNTNSQFDNINSKDMKMGIKTRPQRDTQKSRRHFFRDNRSKSCDTSKRMSATHFAYSSDESDYEELATVQASAAARGPATNVGVDTTIAQKTGTNAKDVIVIEEKSMKNTNGDVGNDLKISKDIEGDFKREIVNADGSRDIWYSNGSVKKISPDNMIIRMLYFNKDIKETDINEGTVKYYYAVTNTWHTTYLDGLEILEFPSGQTERRYKNGMVEVYFPNKSIKVTNPTDALKSEEWHFADGSTMTQMRDGDKILVLPNGQKEIHTKFYKRREYPDGTVKILYLDGSQETCYPNGRVRLRNKDGKLIMDSEAIS